jgi:putative ABC transport system permease protein
MRGIVQDLRYAVRTLRRTPGFTAAAIAALALGIGAATAVWSVVQAVLLAPLPFPAADRLALVWSRSDEAPETWLSLPEIEDLRRGTAFAGVAALRDWTFNLTGGGEPEEVAAAAVSADLFPLLGVAPALGRAFLPEEDRAGAGRVALLSDELWRRRFAADPAVLGRRLDLDGEGHTVVGVLPAGFRIPPPSSVFPARVDVWVPLDPVLFDPVLRRRDVHHLHALGRLAAGATVEGARAEVAALGRRLAREHPEAYAAPGWGLAVEPLREQVVRGARPALLLLSGAVALLLLLVCANVAHLILARNATRAREIAVRAALGAGRGRLARQLLTESLALALAGGALGVLLASAAVDLLAAHGPGDLPRLGEAAVDGRVLAFALAASLATAAIFGLGPALRGAALSGAGSAGSAGDGLRAAGRGVSAGPRIARARDLLAVSQIALALVLLAGSGLLAKSFLALRAAPSGFAPAGVLTLRLSLPATRYPGAGDRPAFFAELERRLAALPGVRAAGAVSHLPLSGTVLGSGFVAEGGPAAGTEVAADLRGTTPGYFAAMGIPLVRGRGFRDADGPEAPPVAVVDETLAGRLWPGEDPVGKRLRWIRSDVPLQVVGVARSVRHVGLGVPPEPTVYRPYAQYARATALFVAVRGNGSAESLAEEVRAAVRALDPGQPVADLRGMESRVEESLGRPRFQALLLGGFAAAALLLAAVGLYGVISYSVAQRTHEIGVRMALGATPGTVRRMVVGRGAAITAAGLAAGLLLALGLARLLAGLLYGVAATDPATYAAVVLLLGAVALLATWLPARRATRVDPLAALNAE